jgi:glycine/D-amino acid oxidase-like deaminating enzyme
MSGGLIVAETPQDVLLLEQRQALQEQWGLPTTLLSAKDVRRIAPYLTDTVAAAGYCANEGHANPRLVTLAFARKAATLGAEISCNSRLQALERAGSEWQLTIAGGPLGELRAGAVLNAAGAWSAEIASMAHLHLPIYPVPLLMNVTERTAPLLPQVVQHASRRLTVKQVAAGNVLVGGGWPGRFPGLHSVMNVRARPDIVAENVTDNLMLAGRLVPAIRQLHLLRSWTGTTGVTADQMPLLGPVPEAPGFFVAAGGAAFTHGPTYARLISELIIGGRPSCPIDLYSPARFSHVNNFMASV